MKRMEEAIDNHDMCLTSNSSAAKCFHQITLQHYHGARLNYFVSATYGASHILLSGLNSRKAYINVFSPIITTKAWNADFHEPGCGLLMAP